MVVETGRIQLLGLSGSLRAASLNTAVLRTLAEALGSEASLQLFPLHDIPPYNQDLDGESAPMPVRNLKAAIAEADGIILCSPEYNYGMSGVLKNALDWVSRPAMKSPLRGKPALLMTASPAYTGGVRAHAQMRETLCACLSRVVARPQVVIAMAHEKVVGGRLIDPAALGFAIEAIGDLIHEITDARLAREARAQAAK